MSAAYFALDRIGRHVAARGGESAKRLDGFDVPLPPSTRSGVGPTLPASPELAPAPSIAISVLGPEIRVGTLPSGKLGTHGVVVSGDYPGTATKLDGLAAAVAKLAPPGPVVVLAPKALPASRVVEIARAAKVKLVLGAAAPEPPTDWQLPAAIPAVIDASAKTKLEVSSAMTVDDLAAKLAAAGAGPVALVGK
jgi:hypothetical protein